MHGTPDQDNADHSHHPDDMSTLTHHPGDNDRPEHRGNSTTPLRPSPTAAEHQDETHRQPPHRTMTQHNGI